jgi:hypothetical protein
MPLYLRRIFAVVIYIIWEVVLAENIKGILFLDYVKMIRSRKNVDWSKYLDQKDLIFVNENIDINGWYPISAFENLGEAVFEEVGQGDVNKVRDWGKFTITELAKVHSDLINKEDPCESIFRFHVLREGFFDYSVIDILTILENRVKLEIDYEMKEKAEMSLTYQTLGFIERLLELSGSKNINHEFLQKIWEGAESTILRVTWD